MNNNSIQINQYLQNEMSAGERATFEQQLATDANLRQELLVQRQIIAAAVNSGIKGEFSEAFRRRRMVKTMITTAVIVVVCSITLLLYNFKDSFYSKNILPADSSHQHSPTRFVNPPLPAADVPFTEYDVDAAQGDTIFHPSGSMLCFPSLAFVDAKGNIVKGTVRIRYREFADPLDFFVSGIPMDYDSAGRKYNFESSGMCEIMAHQNGIALLVNPSAKPVIHLSGSNKSDLHNLYVLDTTNRRWNFMGKDTITAVKDLAGNRRPNTAPLDSSYGLPEKTINIPVKPLKPARASEDRQAFSIEIDPGSFQELYAYDKLKMEVVDESTYNRSDADEHWSSVKLDRTDAAGIYSITFTNPRRSVRYKVRPVLEGADYDAALKVFKEKEKIYQQSIQDRIARDKEEEDAIRRQNKAIQEKMKAETAENNRINAQIIKRNNEMRLLVAERNRIMKLVYEADMKETENQRLRLEQIERDRLKYAANLELSSEIIRTFSINSFGIWNCDHPQYPNLEIPLYSNYTDEKTANIKVTNVAVVYKDFNGVTQFPSGQIRIIPGKQNMLWSIVDTSFYYFTYEDFSKANIQRGTTQFIFKMRKAPGKIMSYNDIKVFVRDL